MISFSKVAVDANSYKTVAAQQRSLQQGPFWELLLEKVGHIIYSAPYGMQLHSNLFKEQVVQFMFS